jgi:hypothetical protein
LYDRQGNYLGELQSKFPSTEYSSATMIDANTILATNLSNFAKCTKVPVAVVNEDRAINGSGPAVLIFSISNDIWGVYYNGNKTIIDKIRL